MPEHHPDDPSPYPEVPESFFSRAVLFELSLVLVAAVLAWVLNVPIFADFAWDWRAGLLGVSSALPLLAFFAWLLQSEYPPFVEIREFLEHFVSRLFGKWNILQLAILSLAAGIGEEILFRGVLQVGVGNITSPITGVLIACFAFALCHAMTAAYFVTTLVIGAYLSLVWYAAGNLIAPIVTHAVYDFVALIFYLRYFGAKNAKAENETAEEP